MEGIVDWQNTKEALNNLMKLFSCSLWYVTYWYKNALLCPTLLIDLCII